MNTADNKQPSFIKKHWGKILVGLLATSFLASIIQERHPQSVVTPLAKYPLSSNESKLLNLFLQDEAQNIATNNNSLFTLSSLGFAEYINAIALSKAYHQNEVAADNQYKGKNILVTGSIESIDKDFMDNAILRLRGTQMFMDVMAYVDDSELANLATMKKGQVVTLSCQGGGMVIGSAVLKDCRNAQTDIFERLSKGISLVIDGRNKDQYSQDITARILSLAKNLKPESECWKDVSLQGCTKDMQALLKDPTMNKDIEIIKQRFN